MHLGKDIVFSFMVVSLHLMSNLRAMESADDLAKMQCALDISVLNQELLKETSSFDASIAQVKSLLNQGANVNVQDPLGHTPLINVISHSPRNREIIQLFLKDPKLNINKRDIFGRTALYYAVNFLTSQPSKDILQLIVSEMAKYERYKDEVREVYKRCCKEVEESKEECNNIYSFNHFNNIKYLKKIIS